MQIGFQWRRWTWARRTRDCSLAAHSNLQCLSPKCFLDAPLLIIARGLLLLWRIHLCTTLVPQYLPPFFSLSLQRRRSFARRGQGCDAPEYWRNWGGLTAGGGALFFLRGGAESLSDHKRVFFVVVSAQHFVCLSGNDEKLLSCFACVLPQARCETDAKEGPLITRLIGSAAGESAL